jgi:hypothetical protein
MARGLARPRGMLARVRVSKYCHHLLLYRQEEIYACEGVELDRAFGASRKKWGDFSRVTAVRQVIRPYLTRLETSVLHKIAGEGSTAARSSVALAVGALTQLTHMTPQQTLGHSIGLVLLSTHKMSAQSFRE